MKKGCPFGTHRVLEPAGVLPQPAWKLDNTMDIYDNEILIDVEVLNIDAASFSQIEEASGQDLERIKEIILETVAKRGKQHNPVTGSGGMLMGRVAQIGPALEGKNDLKVGDKLATLVSLSLTPLKIEEIKAVYPEKDQLAITGKAILFESGIYAKLPGDLPERLALAVFDVAGAPAQTAKLVRPGDTVVVIGGGGKSGLMCLQEAKKRAGVTGRVIGLGHGERDCGRMAELGAADLIVRGNAADAVEVYKLIKDATGGKLADVIINCVNIPGTELASIMATREGGTVYFFSMATGFTAAALGAEGLGKDINMLIGNGYTRGHAEIALQVVREAPRLRAILEKMFG